MTPKPHRPARPDIPLDANALDLFARIVAAGSFARAARGLGLTRAAVSRRVAAIEAALGQPLFTRTTRALGLTAGGRALAAQARVVAEATDAARLGLRARGEGLAGTLRVTSVPTFAHSVLPPLLARFGALHPALRIELSLTHRRVDLVREDVDVAFRITRRPPPGWVARAVLPFTVQAWARPREGLPFAGPQALAEERCLLLSNPVDRVGLHWRHIDGRTLEMPLSPAVVADDLATLVALAVAGDAVVFAPDFSVAADVAAGRLADALPGWQLQLAEGDTVFALTLPPPALPAAARALLNFIGEALGAQAKAAPPAPAPRPGLRAR